MNRILAALSSVVRMMVGFLAAFALGACAPRAVAVRPAPFANGRWPSCQDHCRHLLEGEETVKACRYASLTGELAYRYTDPNFGADEVIVCEIE